MKGIITLVLAVAVIALAPRSLAQTFRASTVQSPPPADSVPAAAPTAAMRAAATDELTANTRVAALVPAGIATRDACGGFQSLAECTAALHASQNLNIPFVQLKERMNGGLSLAATIRVLKPRADSRKEAHRAEQQASDDLRPFG